MSTEKRVMLTIITESVVETALLLDLDRLGIPGYTVTDARGRGSRGTRDANWGETGNIRIEIICSRSLGDSVLAHLRDRYYANYAMVACIHEVDVLRPNKF